MARRIVGSELDPNLWTANARKYVRLCQLSCSPPGVEAGASPSATRGLAQRSEPSALRRRAKRSKAPCGRLIRSRGFAERLHSCRPARSNPASVTFASLPN